MADISNKLRKILNILNSESIREYQCLPNSLNDCKEIYIYGGDAFSTLVFRTTDNELCTTIRDVTLLEKTNYSYPIWIPSCGIDLLHDELWRNEWIETNRNR